MTDGGQTGRTLAVDGRAGGWIDEQGGGIDEQLGGWTAVDDR